jgi:hypothetical protein
MTLHLLPPRLLIVMLIIAITLGLIEEFSPVVLLPIYDHQY